MSERNIDDFNRGAARVLAHLYRSFPTPTLILVEDLDDGADLVPEEHAVRLAERRVVYGATVEFLAAEGLLVYTGSAGSAASRKFSGARLTAKGLGALNRTPEALTPARPSLGDQLVGAAGDGAREVLRQLIGMVLGG
jgi:hypothetical protein